MHGQYRSVVVVIIIVAVVIVFFCCWSKSVQSESAGSLLSKIMLFSVHMRFNSTTHVFVSSQQWFCCLAVVLLLCPVLAAYTHNVFEEAIVKLTAQSQPLFVVFHGVRRMACMCAVCLFSLAQFVEPVCL